MNESIGELLFIAHSTLLSERIDVGEGKQQIMYKSE